MGSVLIGTVVASTYRWCDQLYHIKTIARKSMDFVKSVESVPKRDKSRILNKSHIIQLLTAMV